MLLLAENVGLPIAATLAALCYLNSLHGDFVHDDVKAIVSNADVEGESPMAEVFMHDFWGGDLHSNTSHKSYRPLTILSFRATYAVFGLRPFAYHVVNVALHVLVTSLLQVFVSEMDKKRRESAVTASLLFAVHPIHTEAVAGLVGRADVLCAVFFISCLIAYQRGINANTRWRNGWLLMSFLMATCSTLSKEQGITSLAMCFLIEVTERMRRAKKSAAVGFWLRLFCITFYGAMLLWCRWRLMAGELPTFIEQDNPAAFHPRLITRVLSRAYVYSLNLRLLLLPTQLSHDWSANSIALVHNISDVRNLQTLFAFGLLICVSWTATKAYFLRRQPGLLLSLGFLVLPFVPASSLLFTVGFVLAERVLYIPSMGFCALLGCAISKMDILTTKQKFTSLALLCTMLGVKTLLRNGAWQNRESLTRAGLLVLPHNAKLHYNFANLLKDTGRSDEAIGHYQEALRNWPHYPSAHNNLGTLLSPRDPALAEWHFRSAVKQASCHSNALFNLGNLLITQNDGRLDEGILHLMAASHHDPKSHLPQVQLGLAFHLLNKSNQGLEHFKKAHELQPNDANIMYNVAFIYNSIGQIAEAAIMAQKCTDSDHQSINCLELLSSLLPASLTKKLYTRALEGSPSCDLLLSAAKVSTQWTQLFDRCAALARKSCVASGAISMQMAKVLHDAGYSHEALYILQSLPLDGENKTPIVLMQSSLLGSLTLHAQALRMLGDFLNRQGLTNDDAGKIHLEMGKHFRDIHLMNESVNHLKRAVQLNGADAESQHYLAILHHKQGDFEDALNRYQRALSLQPNNRLIEENLKKLKRILHQHNIQLSSDSESTHSHSFVFTKNCSDLQMRNLHSKENEIYTHHSAILINSSNSQRCQTILKPLQFGAHPVGRGLL